MLCKDRNMVALTDLKWQPPDVRSNSSFLCSGHAEFDSAMRKKKAIPRSQEVD